MSARETLKLVKPKIIFCIEEIAEILMKAAKLENTETKFVVFGKYTGTESLDNILNFGEEEVKNYVPKRLKSLDEIAFLVFSSGSTGLPKSVLHSYESVFKNFFCGHIFAERYGKALFYTTTNWISANMWIIVGIMNECTRFIHQKFDVDKTSQVIDTQKVRKNKR